MKKFLVSLAALLSFSAFAVTGSFTDAQGNSATFTEEPCTIGAYTEIPGIKGGTLNIGGKEYKMCYAVVGDVILIADEDHDQYSLPLAAVK
jgi:hypothetical protein